MPKKILEGLYTRTNGRVVNVRDVERVSGGFTVKFECLDGSKPLTLYSMAQSRFTKLFKAN